MQLSVIGLVICAGLLIVSFNQRTTLSVAFIASFAFGATSIVKLDALGGSSPLIYTVFAALLVSSALVRRSFLHDFGVVISRSKIPWILIALGLYAIGSAMILPRLFAGHTTAFVPVRDSGEVLELPLAPVSGNLTQTAYFTLGVLIFMALSMRLLQRDYLQLVLRGFFALCIAHAGLGFIDLAGKLSGAGDVLTFMRSASYALATNVEEGGFYRIAGGFSEASAYGGYTLACLAFTLTFWRRTGSRLALALTGCLSALLVLSTSTTAYVGAGLIVLLVGVSSLRSVLEGKFLRQDVTLAGLALIAVTATFAIQLVNPDFLQPLLRLFESTVLNKSSSVSADERMYWTTKSIQSVIDTAGLGIGFGSSRSSSWIVSVVSQLGVLGSILMAALVIEFARGIKQSPLSDDGAELVAVHDSVRSFALLWISAAVMSGGSAEPGALFFVALATVIACRQHLESDHDLLHYTPAAATSR
jgi:hypothetical protein